MVICNTEINYQMKPTKVRSECGFDYNTSYARISHIQNETRLRVQLRTSYALIPYRPKRDQTTGTVITQVTVKFQINNLDIKQSM